MLAGASIADAHQKHPWTLATHVVSMLVVRGEMGTCKHVREMANLLPADQMLSTGLVDYALGAEPHTGAFVVVHEESPLKKAQLAYYKLGDGPFTFFIRRFICLIFRLPQPSGAQ